MLASAVLSIPVLVIVGSFYLPQWELWQHLLDTVLQDYVVNSLLLALGVGLGCLLIGTSLAWLISQYDFWGRSVLQWLLVLPLAMPAYITAYTYSGIMDYDSWLQSQLRAWFGWGYQDYWFPDIRTLPGAIWVMVMVLYPYVFILARTAFNEQSVRYKEVCQTMGISAWRYKLRIVWPLSRPALITGMALTMMEALADYGTVQFYGVSTFTTGIFRTWFGMGNPLAASQLAGLLCVFVLVLILLEKSSRQKVRYFQTSQIKRPSTRIKLGSGKSIAAVVFCLIFVALGFIIPVMQLLNWILQIGWHGFDERLFERAWNSIYLATVAAIVTVALASLFCYGKRLQNHWLIRWQVQVVSMGYAIPGTVIAVGVMTMLSWTDKRLNEFTQWSFDWTPGLLLSGTIFALIFAYAIRFLSVAIQNVDAGLQRVTPSMDDAARSMGLTPLKVLGKIHIPLLRSSILSALLLVFVDVLKELPATLILRPFNFDTLAVTAFQYASDERLPYASLPSVAIVLAGIVPVILLTKALDNQTES